MVMARSRTWAVPRNYLNRALYVKPLQGITLLGAALLLAGCTDNATAPPATKKAPTSVAAARAIDLRGRPDLRATITTVATVRSKDGRVNKWKFSQKVTAHFKGGLARAKKDAVASADKSSSAFASLTEGSAMFAQFTAPDGSYTPVIAATSGTLAYNYHDSQIDSNGDKYDLYAWAASAGTPITDAWGYKNEVLIASFHANWYAVSGGYTLADQTLSSYNQDGTRQADIVSTVSGGGGGGDGCSTNTGCIEMTGNPESLRDRVSAPFFAAIDKVGCWLTPKAAYGSVQCAWRGLMFAAETFGLGAATFYGGPFAEQAAVALAWWLQWPTWTTSLYDWAECLDSAGQTMGRGPPACTTNSFLCK